MKVLFLISNLTGRNLSEYLGSPDCVLVEYEMHVMYVSDVAHFPFKTIRG